MNNGVIVKGYIKLRRFPLCFLDNKLTYSQIRTRNINFLNTQNIYERPVFNLVVKLEDVRSPFPTFHIIPFLSNPLVFKIFFHASESLYLRTQLKRSELCKYFVFMYWTHKREVPIRIFHASVHWNAMLEASILRSSTPLSHLYM